MHEEQQHRPVHENSFGEFAVTVCCPSSFRPHFDRQRILNLVTHGRRADLRWSAPELSCCRRTSSSSTWVLHAAAHAAGAAAIGAVSSIFCLALCSPQPCRGCDRAPAAQRRTGWGVGAPAAQQMHLCTPLGEIVARCEPDASRRSVRAGVPFSSLTCHCVASARKMGPMCHLAVVLAIFAVSAPATLALEWTKV